VFCAISLPAFLLKSAVENASYLSDPPNVTPPPGGGWFPFSVFFKGFFVEGGSPEVFAPIPDFGSSTPIPILVVLQLTQREFDVPLGDSFSGLPSGDLGLAFACVTPRGLRGTRVSFLVLPPHC